MKSPKPGDVVRDRSIPWLRLRLIERGTLTRQRWPGWRCEILNGHEKGARSFILDTDMRAES